MKKITNYILSVLIFSAFMFSGCEDFLDKQPISQLSRDRFWNTPKDADIWIAGMYDGLQKTLGDNYYNWGEVRGDNSQQAGTGTAQLNFLTNTITASMGECSWANLYRTISSANFAIKYIPTIPNVPEPQVASQLAQAYAMRALMYFYAIRVWGPVPLITEPYEGLDGQEKFPIRSEVEIVKNQILSDIEQALLKFDNSFPSIYKLNRASTLALKADVYMWFKQYDQVLIATDNLLSMGKFTLAANEPDWKKIFTDPASSSESIFNIYWDFLQDGGGNGVASFYGSGSNTPKYKIRQPLWDTLISRGSDARLWNMYDTVDLWYRGDKVKVTYESYNLNFSWVSCKFVAWDPAKPNTTYNYLGGYNYPANSESQTHIPVYRFSDIMLMRAEALNKSGRRTEARDIVNNIRKRVGYNKLLTPENTPDEASLENAILTERQVELWGEGKRWFDLIRTEKVKEIMDPVLIERGVVDGFDDIRKIRFPIHTSVFESNPNIIQNEPYTQN